MYVLLPLILFLCLFVECGFFLGAGGGGGGGGVIASLGSFFPDLQHPEIKKDYKFYHY